MALKKGDIIDEHKRHPDSCGLVVKVMNGGEGFEKIMCCGNELTTEDVVPSFSQGRGRRKGSLVAGFTIDENRVSSQSCGLRLMVMGGGEGFQKVMCCGHSIEAGAMQDLRFGQMRTDDTAPEPTPNTPHQGTA